MSEILSQDEVDALLKGVEEGEVETEPKAPPPRDVATYDLTSQERIIRGRMPGLESVHERFAWLMRVRLSNFLKKFVAVSVQGINTIKFGELMKTIPLPSSINMFKMRPLKGHSLMIFEAPFVFAMVEYFFGGSKASHVKTEGRSFTAVEQRLINRILQMSLEEFEKAWKAICEIDTEFTGSETNPQFVTILTPTDVIIKIEIHVEMEDFTGKIHIGIPYATIEPIKEKLYSGISTDAEGLDSRWFKRIKELMYETNVNISVEIDRVELTIREILNLKEGDILTLGRSVKDELVMNVEGVPKFYCLPGVRNGSQAVRITRTINRTNNSKGKEQ